ncbi:MAG: VWA domain-containing protein [Candidatus Roizmanbacteria bacterium]|nr:MAG: VWA domain-containing protein [Candidatus Roizmanbacteria bacterium]
MSYEDLQHPQYLAALGGKPPPDKPVDPEIRKHVESLQWASEVMAGTGIKIRVYPGKKAFFTHEDTPTAHFGSQLSEKLQLTTPERVFVLGHEIGHFLQYLEDPITYKQVFEIIKAKAGDNPAHKRAWKKFFNIYLDLNDNNRIVKRMQAFQPGEKWQETPTELYDKKLFPGADYSQRPHHSQLLDYTIKKLMVPDAQINVSPQVAQVLAQPIDFLGTHYDSMEDFIRAEVQQAPSLASAIFSLKNVVMPVFEKLLQDDIDNNRSQKPKNAEGEDNEEEDGDIDEDFDPTDADNFKEVDKYLDKKNRSSSQNAKENQRKDFEERMKNCGHSDEEIQTMWERKERTAQVINNLKDLWWRLIQKSFQESLQAIPGFTSGTRVNFSSIPGQLANLLSNPASAAIFEKDLMVPSGEEIHPKEIVIMLPVDYSGSTFQSGQKIINLEEDAEYAIGQSLILFTKEGQINNTVFPVRVSLMIVPYGTRAFTSYNRRISDNPQQSEDNLLDTTINSHQCLDGTYDYSAFKQVLDELSKLPASDPKDTLRILIEITDGATEKPEDGKGAIKLLEEKGVICRAIQIPPDYSIINLPDEIKEKMVDKPVENSLHDDPFQFEWGEKGQKLRRIEDLLPTLEKLLADILIK